MNISLLSPTFANTKQQTSFTGKKDNNEGTYTDVWGAKIPYKTDEEGNKYRPDNQWRCTEDEPSEYNWRPPTKEEKEDADDVKREKTRRWFG